MKAALDIKHIYFQLLQKLREMQPCVLTTVTNVQGSTLRNSGYSDIFNKKGLLAVTVGGGAAELAIGEIASKNIQVRNKANNQ